MKKKLKEAETEIRDQESRSPQETARRSKRRREKNEKGGLFRLLMPVEGKRIRTNRYIFYTFLFAVLLFAALIAYLVWFTVRESAEVITSPYNKRTSVLENTVLRGSILSANGKELAVSGINEDGEEYREYPYENMFAHVVGYATYGKGGLESACNYDLLTSHTEILKQMQNEVSGDKSPGDNVTTTLDTRLQKAAYEALGDYDGAVIAIEPKTGKVRVMVSKPDFDPNTLDEKWEEINEDSDNSCLLNRCVQGLYPPGSTYKLLTALEYLRENGNSYEGFSYDCEGETVINSVRIRCYKGAEHGEEDMATAFAKSCNTAFVQIGCNLKRKSFLALNKTFLFNQEISFDLSVKRSRFELTEQSEESELPQTVIGQGDTLMTPFHNALIMCAVANDGVLMKPYLVESVDSTDGINVSQTQPQEYATLMESAEAEKLQELLENVVENGTGRELQTDLYTAAGKTGSAENEKENAHAWFYGYSNVEDPDLVVCVLVENVGSGSEYAVPIAKKVFDSYYNNEMDEEYR